ncbi:hypothetical protein Gotri_013295, partial [Gossypium trilobum]|nr:hypothetical protein [Gossypium trilobum]
MSMSAGYNFYFGYTDECNLNCFELSDATLGAELEGNQCTDHLANLAQAKSIAGVGVYLSNPPLSLLSLLHEDSREHD